MDRVKRIWYLSPMRAAKVQASLRIRAVSPEPSLLAHTSSESRGTFRQKARSLVPLNGWACAVKICHDGMLEDTNSLDGAHIGWPRPAWTYDESNKLLLLLTLNTYTYARTHTRKRVMDWMDGWTGWITNSSDWYKFNRTRVCPTCLWTDRHIVFCIKQSRYEKVFWRSPSLIVCN